MVALSKDNTAPAKPRKVARENLMRDPRVRAEITENLYKDMLFHSVIVVVISMTFWYEFINWPEPANLIIALITWWFASILYQALNIYHRFQPSKDRLSEGKIIFFLRLYKYGVWLDSISAGVFALALYKTRPDRVLMVVVALTMYAFGIYIKNMSYASISKTAPTLMTLPLVIVFIISGESLLIIIAIFFILYSVGLIIYSNNIADAIQLPIKQRFELEELNRQLNLERDRADAANAAKSHFFTAASHDARQPLQVISLLFQNFQKSTQASDQDKKIIEKIDVNLKTIRNLFDRVLDISRIDSGNVTPNMQPVRLQTLFDKFDAQFGELAASKGVWLRFVPTEACVQHDLELLDRMVSNLVHNAIKYTPTGGVWVAWRCARGRLEVRDSGLGISGLNQQTVFQEFAQINNPARNNEAGLGLGLSIVKRLADLTETPLGLNSKLNSGSTFWMQLKTTQAQTLPSFSSDHNIVASSTDALPSGANQLAGIHILYAEDEPQISELFTQMLQDAGAVVYPCADVSDAIAIVNTKLIVDIVLTDYRLGASGTGLDVVHAARTRHHEYGSDKLPAVILTGDTAVKDLLSIQQLPYCTLLHKPVDFEQLAGVLKTAINRRL